ncbi:MAG: ATP-dependent DNA helicase RecG [Bacteroidaceae bacterium]|nr:ATP-dependent DNA helicase RecG [Bacteroidaceae bacterium]
MLRLDQDIKYLQGVGPQRADLLGRELSIKTVGDLLTYYPYKYIDRTRFYRICDINGTMPYVQIVGEILGFDDMGEGRKKRLVAHFSDGTGVIDLVWFQGIKYIAKQYDLHRPYVVFGRPQPFKGRLNIAHPEIEVPSTPPEWGRTPVTEGIQQALFDEGTALNPPPFGGDGGGYAFRPHYHTTEKMKKRGLNSSVVAKLTAKMLEMLDETLPETLPAFLVSRYHFISRDEALREIHFPTTADNLRKAQARLKFEELFYVQLNILRYAKDRARKYRGLLCPHVGKTFNDFYYHHLPFTLTEAQKRVIREIRADMGSGRQMNRLLQGDVGSGKTLVALMCALIAIDNGYQACIMAPTEILAEQHVETLRHLLGDMPVRVELLTGAVKGKRRREVLDGFVTGTVHIAVGTHALIENNVQFAHLGLAIIDEQHRFGVAQRARLWTKSLNPPHVLVMTATPIPRTLAMTLYGDLDVSVIDQLPPGRKPIQTLHQFDSHRQTLYTGMRRQLELGRQIYIVYPLIKESEKMDLKNLEDGFEQIRKAFPDKQVSKVHGKMKSAEKDAEMQRFASGATQILVATTVIEVGVNVPNASVMVIENAERFGLSQLHQLRGRVGRGADQSYCILVTKQQLSDDTRRRIQIMVDSTDGFEIAEQDLRLRGPGDLEGTQQSGMAFDLKIANLAKDGIILQMARDAAQQVVEADPEENNPANALLWQRLRELRKTNINWGSIS